MTMRACCCCVILAAIIVSAVGAVAGAVFIGSQPASRASLGAQKVVGPGVGLSGQPRSDRLLVANFLGSRVVSQTRLGSCARQKVW